MLGFPDNSWINEQIIKQDQYRVVFNGLNLFAIWLKDNNVPDEPCPPDIDIRIWEGSHAYLYAWDRLEPIERQKWSDLAHAKFGFHKVIEH